MTTRRATRAELISAEMKQLPDEQCEVTVKLGRELGPSLKQTYIGRAEGPLFPLGEVRCTAEASLRALERAFGVEDGTFSVVRLKTVESFDCLAVLVEMSAQPQRSELPRARLLGFCEIKEDAKVAAAKAALNGTNRYVGYHLGE
ncbi:MAG: hypothetical protein P8X82_14855 [Gemmatimonadales bacterium]|jgi:hypothetical protein